METVYLIEQNLSKVIEDGIVDLFNSRNSEKHGISLAYGQTYGDMKELLEANEPVKGSGYTRTKEGIGYWVLPFRSHPLMGTFGGVTVLSKEELEVFGWDVEEIEQQ